MRNAFSKIVVSAAVACALLTVASLLGRYGWFFEIMANLRVQLVLAGAAAGVLAVVVGHWLAGAAALALAVIAALPLLPYFTAPQPGQNSGLSLKVLTLNLHGLGTEEEKLGRMLARERPDVLVLTETDAQQEAVIDELAKTWSHRQSGRLGEPFETVILSRWPIVERAADVSVAPWLPVTAVRLCPTQAPGQACVTLVALHAPRPLRWPTGPARRNAALAVAMEMSKRYGDAWRIVAGDLNVTPWSPVFEDALERGGLRDAGLGFGLTPTWFSRAPTFGLKLDHVLVSERVRVVEHRVGADVGSDHYPVLVDLLLGE